MKLLLRIAYDGTHYCGFQKQDNGLSVQEALTEALSKTLGFPCSVTGSSRTDAGVHALGFCAAIAPVTKSHQVAMPHQVTMSLGEDWLSIPPAKFHRAAKRFLPADIAITGACLVPDEFHPRYSVVGKTYLYRMSDRPFHDPFCTDRVWETYVPFTEEQVAHMEKVGQVLLGKHDFASFMASGSKITDPTRTITALTVRRTGPGSITLRVSADGFLYNMVRIITGTLWEFGKNLRPIEELEAILAAKDRTKAGKTAPACGLYLEEVEYPGEYGIVWQCE